MMFDGPTHALSVSFHEKSEGRVSRIRGDADLGHDVLHCMVDAGSAIALACTCLKKTTTDVRRVKVVSVNELM